MRFKLCIILIVISIFTFSSVGMAAEFGKSHQPRITIDTTKGPFHIWAFYDTGLQMLCYVTKDGNTMSCTPHHQLTSATRSKIENHIEKLKEEGSVPSIIHVP